MMDASAFTAATGGYAILAAAGGGGGLVIQQFALLGLILVVFYFLLIRPQQKRMKEHQAMIAGLKRGDQVATSGGLLGRIHKVGDDELTLEIAENVRVRVIKSTVSEVRARTKPSKAANDDADEADDETTGA